MSWILGTDNTSFWSDLTSIGHNAVYGTLTDAQKADVTKQGQSEIQGVVSNLQDHYASLPPDQVAQAQRFADAQKKALANDVQTLTQGQCGADLDLSGIGLGCQSLSSLLKWGAILVVAILALYVITIVAPFLPKKGS